MKRKIFYGAIIILTIVIIFNLGSIYFKKNKRQQNTIETNKQFIIESNFNKANAQFSFSTENSLKNIEKLGHISSNISLIVFNIRDINSDELSKLMDLHSNVRLGFDFLDEDILKKANYFGHSSLLKLNFDSNSPLINNSNDGKIIINPNYSVEENKVNFAKLENIAKQYNVNFYLNENDVTIIGHNREFLYKVSLMQPFIIKNTNKCNLTNHLCFFDKTVSSEEITKNFEDILSKDQTQKWFISIEHRADIDKLIKHLIELQNHGTLKIS